MNDSSTMSVNGPVALSGEEAAQVIASLNAQIVSLRRQLESERDGARRREASAVQGVVRGLRLYGVVLLHNGEMPLEEVRERVGSYPATMAALEEVWQLKNAPLPQSVIDQMQKATAGGMFRF